MTERSPIFSAKHVGRQIGYIQGTEAFDLLARPCATYECETGLLRDPKTNTIVGYLSLKSTFVGCSWMADKLFPAGEGGVLPEERGTNDVERRNAIKPAGTAALAEMSKTAGAEGPEVGIGNFENSNALAAREQALPGERDFAIPLKATLEARSSNDQPLTGVDQAEIFATSFSQSGREPDQARSPREQNAEGERALVAELSAQGDAARDQPNGSIIDPLTSWPGAREQAAPLTPSETHESDLEHSGTAVKSGESSVLATVETFMQRLAEHVQSADAAETGGEMSNQDETDRLFSGSDDHNDSAQKQLQDQSDTDSPNLLDSGAGVGLWPHEERCPASLNNTESASIKDELLPPTLVEPARHNDNGNTPGEDPVVVNEVTSLALPEQKMPGQLTGEPGSAEESGQSER